MKYIIGIIIGLIMSSFVFWYFKSVYTFMPCVEDGEHLNGQFYFRFEGTTVYMLPNTELNRYEPFMVCN